MSNTNCLPRWWWLLPAVVVVGCTVGPDFEVPAMQMPAAFSRDGLDWKRQSPEALPESEAWWKVYRDGALNGLVDRALEHNQTIEAAGARLEQARAVSQATRSQYFPNIELGTGATRTKSLFRGPGGGSILYNSFTMPLDLRYELDMWGKVRRQVEGAKASEAAASESIRALQLTIAGEVAQTYWALRAVDADRALMERTLRLRRKALDLLTRQRDAGAISGLDLARARTEVASAEADRIRLDQQRVELVNALAVLTGRMATGMEVNESEHLPSPPRLPTRLPSQVVFQRPDVRVALHRVAAANAEIGVATAALYPSFTIDASLGFDSRELRKLLDIDSLVWSLGGDFLLPVSSQKYLRHQRDAAVAAHRAATADYRQSIIESVGEIETALQGGAILERRQQAQAEAVRSAREAYERSLQSFEAGMVSFLDVVDAERTQLAAERGANAIRAEALAISVALIKAAGGTW